MARNKSIILSKEEKKAIVTTLKSQIKETQVLIKLHTASVKASEKEHNTKIKVVDKEIKGLTKFLVTYQAQLGALTAPTPAVA